MEEAEIMLGGQEYKDIGCAKIDFHRSRRRGTGEVIFCQGKELSHLVHIYETFRDRGVNVMGTRATKEQYEAVFRAVPEVYYDESSRILKYEPKPAEQQGLVAVWYRRYGGYSLCGGGSTDSRVSRKPGTSGL